MHDDLFADIAAYLAGTLPETDPDDDSWGRCPECSVPSSLFLHDGPNHWAICPDDRVRWYVGSNLFSIWWTLTDEEQAEQRAALADYREVVPL